MNMRAAAGLALLLLSATNQLRPVLACKCVNEDNIYKQSKEAENLYKVEIHSEVEVDAAGMIMGEPTTGKNDAGPDGKRHFMGTVRRSFQGCIPPKSEIVLETCGALLCCGLNLRPGNSYLLETFDPVGPAVNGTLTRSVEKCGVHASWDAMRSREKMWIRNQPKVCGVRTTCVNGVDLASTSCANTPCEEEKSCGVVASTCLRNPCRRCGVEWYDRDSVFLARCSDKPVTRTMPFPGSRTAVRRRSNLGRRQRLQ